MKRNIKFPFSKLRAVDLLALFRNVIAKMTGNVFFPNPPVTMADAGLKADALEAAIEEATDSSKASRAVRDALVLETGAMLRALADYQRMVSNGSEVMLASGGFELAKVPEPVGVPGIPQRLEVRFTNRQGELKLRWRSEPGSHGYQVWMTDKDPTLGANWTAIGYTTRVSHLVDGLESFKAYWFCVSAIGVAGEGRQSDPAMGRAA